MAYSGMGALVWRPFRRNQCFLIEKFSIKVYQTSFSFRRSKWCLYHSKRLQIMYIAREMLLVREDQILPYIPVLWIHTSQLPCQYVVLQRMRRSTCNFYHFIPFAVNPYLHGHILLLPEILLLQKKNTQSAVVWETWIIREAKGEEGVFCWWRWRWWWITHRTNS